MKKTSLFAVLPVILLIVLTGCGDKNEVSPSTPSSPIPVTSGTATPSADPTKPTVKPSDTTTTKTGLENTDAAGLGDTIKDYNAEVDASNDKARGVIDAYNERIESATGK